MQAHGNSNCSCCDGRGTVGIDIHAHYYPESYLRLIEAEGGPFGAHFERTDKGPKVRVGPTFAGPIGSKFIDLDERLQAMDAQGVTAQALSLTQPMVYWARGDAARRLSAAFNDAVADAHERHPDRFYGLAILPMQDAALALAELERVSRLPGIRGVYLATYIDGRQLSDKAFWPVYERLEALRLPIFLHPVEVIGMQDRLGDYFLSNLLGNPFDTAVAAAHLVLGQVMDRFPKLDVVLPHGGGALPFLIGRIEHGWRVRPECRHLERSPRDYLRRFHYDTITHSPEALTYLIDLVGADRVLLGSDYCFDMGYDQPVEVVNTHGSLTEKDRAAILTTNAARLLRLDEIRTSATPA
jgi:aminocarboxymuconate-semialdehyde decarboxylase